MTLDEIAQSLQQHRAQTSIIADYRRAAVAMLLAPGGSGPEVLFIRRAEYEGDPWSGDVAFPGGGIEAQDADAQSAAVREVWEEIGLHLQPEQCLGRLDDLAGAYLPIQVACFVFRLSNKPQLQLNGEVVDTFWVPLGELLSAQRRRQETFEFRGQLRNNPIIDLTGYCDRFLWGITYRLFENFFNLLGCRPQSISKKA